MILAADLGRQFFLDGAIIGLGYALLALGHLAL